MVDFNLPLKILEQPGLLCLLSYTQTLLRLIATRGQYILVPRKFQEQKNSANVRSLFPSESSDTAFAAGAVSLSFAIAFLSLRFYVVQEAILPGKVFYVLTIS